MEERKILELVSMEEVRKVARIDSAMVSTSPKTYVQDNVLTYYILINTWLLMVRDYAQYGWVGLSHRIGVRGLITTIKELQVEADRIVHGFPISDSLVRALYQEVCICGKPGTVPLFDALNIGRESMATLLFLVRYPKRFSPVNADIIQTESLQDFIAMEKRTKLWQRAESSSFRHENRKGEMTGVDRSRYVISHVRDCIASMYDWDQLCDQIENMDITDIKFSSGAGTDSKASLGSKLIAIWKKHPEYFYRPFGAYVVPMQTRDLDEHIRVARVQAVPKSYKAARIIAMEDTYRNAVFKRIEDFFRAQDKTRGGLNLEDQTINQEYAWYGSLDGYYSTLDASHASDLISVSLFKELFPRRYVDLVLPLIATHYEINGKRYLKQMLSTSGHTSTFRHESIVYKAIGLAASRVKRLFTYGNDETAFAWAFGDDTIVKTEDVDTVIEFFERLGLIINNDKSFTNATGGYRESCGEEYYYGLTMTSLYYPRFPIVGTTNPITFTSRLYNDSYRGKIDDSTTMVIDLQQKLYNVSISASRFLAAVIREAYPKMTTSLYGSPSPDVWGTDDLGKTRVPKQYQILHGISFKQFAGYLIQQDSCPPALFPMESKVPDAVLAEAKRDTYHYTPYLAYDGAEFPESYTQLYDMYKYMTFLREGPRYNSELDRLLRVSAPYPKYSEIFGKRRMAWRYTLV
jgi:hypothetical protein